MTPRTYKHWLKLSHHSSTRGRGSPTNHLGSANLPLRKGAPLLNNTTDLLLGCSSKPPHLTCHQAAPPKDPSSKGGQAGSHKASPVLAHRSQGLTRVPWAHLAAVSRPLGAQGCSHSEEDSEEGSTHSSTILPPFYAPCLCISLGKWDQLKQLHRRRCTLLLAC